MGVHKRGLSYPEKAGNLLGRGEWPSCLILYMTVELCLELIISFDCVSTFSVHVTGFIQAFTGSECEPESVKQLCLKK